LSAHLHIRIARIPPDFAPLSARQTSACTDCSIHTKTMKSGVTAKNTHKFMCIRSYTQVYTGSARVCTSRVHGIVRVVSTTPNPLLKEGVYQSYNPARLFRVHKPTCFSAMPSVPPTPRDPALPGPLVLCVGLGRAHAAGKGSGRVSTNIISATQRTSQLHRKHCPTRRFPPARTAPSRAAQGRVSGPGLTQ